MLLYCSHPTSPFILHVYISHYIMHVYASTSIGHIYIYIFIYILTCLVLSIKYNLIFCYVIMLALCLEFYMELVVFRIGSISVMIAIYRYIAHYTGHAPRS